MEAEESEKIYFNLITNDKQGISVFKVSLNYEFHLWPVILYNLSQNIV